MDFRNLVWDRNRYQPVLPSHKRYRREVDEEDFFLYTSGIHEDNNSQHHENHNKLGSDEYEDLIGKLLQETPLSDPSVFLNPASRHSTTPRETISVDNTHDGISDTPSLNQDGGMTRNSTMSTLLYATGKFQGSILPMTLDFDVHTSLGDR